MPRVLLRHALRLLTGTAALAVLASAVPWASVQAQAVAGVGDDAIPIPAGRMRLLLGAQWDEWDQRLLPTGGRGPVLGGLSTSTFGTAQLPALETAQSGIRSLSGASDFSLSLGPLEARGGVRRSTTVFRADFGITRRISVGLRVPYVEVVHDARLVLNRDGSGANVGANPARFGASALASNGSVFVQIGNARTQLLEAIASCTTGGSETCDAILANPAAAAALAARAEAFRASWREVYGDGTYPGAPVVPVQTSDAHEAITEALGALRAEFERYFNTNIPQTGPLGPTRVYGSAGLQELAQDSAFGINADTLDRAFRAGMGDIDVEARVLVYDTWGGDQIARLSTTTSGFRVLASGGWRFGTASSAQVNQPFALATGDGVNALLLRVTADAVWKQRAWVSATLRSTTPLADNAVIRLPGAGLADFFFAGRPQATSRRLGQRFDLEIAPRLNIGDKFGVSALWMVRSIGADRYDPLTGGDSFQTPSGTVQFGSLGVTYSTLAAFTRGKSKLAIEVHLARDVALSASGVTVPSLARDRLELRVFPRFPKQ